MEQIQKKIQTEQIINVKLKNDNENLENEHNKSLNIQVQNKQTKQEIIEIIKQKQKQIEIRQYNHHQKYKKKVKKDPQQEIKQSKTIQNNVNKVTTNGKSRAKIFKQQLIDSIPKQNKTSLHRWTYGQGATSSKILISNWNVNGIRSVMGKKTLFQYIHSNKPDIICISETKIDQKNFDSSPIYLPGYHGYWNFSKHSSGYSGVVIFSKFLPKSALQDMNQRQHSQQGRLLTLQFQKFMLMNIYVPTVGKDLERIQYRKKFDTAFRQHILRIKQEYPDKPVFVVGDLNVAHTELDTHPGKNIMLSPSFTTIQRTGLTQLINLGFTDVYRSLHPDTRAYTWWYVNIGGRDRLDTPGLGRRIDYFLLPNECMRWVKRCDILRQIYGADHCPVELQLDLQL